MQGLRVLVVRPQPDEQLATFLRNDYVYTVETLTSYEQVWEAIDYAPSPYDVVLINEDIPLFVGEPPKPLGIDLMRAIKSHRPQTGCIILRGGNSPYDLDAALEAGAFRYLPQPADPKELAILIRHAARHQKLQSDAHWAEQVTALQKTALNITSYTDQEQLLTAIVEEAVKLLHAQNGGLYKYYPARHKEHLEIIAHYKRRQSLGKIVEIGEGIAGKLLLPDSPDVLHARDYNASLDRIPRFVDSASSRSMIAVRLKWQEAIIGVLYVNDAVGRIFDASEIRLLRMFADHAAIALHNRELAQQNERKLQRLEKLSHATTEIMGSLGTATLDEQMQMIARHAVQILDAEVCRVFLLTRPGWLSVRASYGDKGGQFIHGEEYAIRSQHRGGITSYIADQGVIFRAHGVELWENPYSDGVLPDHLPSGSRYSLLAIPLKHEGRLIGLLRIENKKNEQGYATPTVGFLDEDVWSLSIFAETVVTALQNAALIRKQALLLQAIETVSTAGNPTEGLQRFAEMMPTLFDHTFCRVLLMDASGQTLQAKAAYSSLHAEQLPGWKPGMKARSKIVEWADWDKVLRKDTPTVLSSSKEHQRPILQRFSDVLELPMPIQQLLLIPLKIVGETVGLLEVGEVRYGARYGFTQEQQSLLSAVTAQITSLVNLVRLQEITEHHQQTAIAIAKVTAQEDRNVMPAIAQGILEAVGCDAVTMYSFDQKTRKLSYPPAVAGVRHPERLRPCPDVAANPRLFHVLFRDDPYCVARIMDDAIFQHSDFARAEGIQACIAMPLQAAGQRVGVMFVNYRRPQPFTDALVANLRLFAEQAAVALRNMQLHTRAEKQRAMLEATQRASHAVNSALDLVLDQIAEQAWHATNERDPHSGFASIWLVKELQADLRTAYPQENFKTTHMLRQRPDGVGPKIVQDIGVGIIGRTIRTREAQFVEDVTDDKEYLPAHRGTRSEFTMPIKIGDAVVGVINVEYFYLKTFDEDDQRALEALAMHASTALRNAGRDAELRHTQALVSARTALAWMGMASATALHSINIKTSTVLDLVGLARRDLRASKPIIALEKRLDAIAEATKNMQETPITALSSTGTDVTLVPINALVRERLDQLWQQERYQEVALQKKSLCGASLFVRANPEWLKKALTIPIDNAVRAMEESVAKRLTVATCVQGNYVEIHVQDTGSGIPQAIKPLLLHGPVAKLPGMPGMGMGLLMAQTIVQAYEGSLDIRDTGPHGTTLVIRLPLVTECIS